MKASSVTLSIMVFDVSMLKIAYISAADQLSVFVHTERLNKIEIKPSLHVCTKTDQLLISNQYVKLKHHKP